MNKILPIFILFSLFLQAQAQDSTNKKNNVELSGYIKDMQSILLDNDFSDLTSANLLHNRINLKWRAGKRITAVTEFRNRLFWGEQVKLTPNFSSLLRNDNELVNLQHAWINNNLMVFHTNTERAYVEYQGERLNIRVGRQRINWGVTNTWNANDIFNTYNFLDFDYEERPGADGIKTRYTLKDNSNLELALSNTGKKKGSIIALKYAFNKKNYDLQGILGIYKEHLTAGAGWAGYIKDAGFKGEMQYFFKKDSNNDHLNITLEFDYMFPGGWYFNAAGLFNNRGMTSSLTNWEELDLKLSPENPMPTEWNFILTTAKEINPLLTSQLGIMYAPGTQLVFILPSLQYNIATNLDISLIWQSFFCKLDGNFTSVNHQCFLRMKWSF